MSNVYLNEKESDVVVDIIVMNAYSNADKQEKELNEAYKIRQSAHLMKHAIEGMAMAKGWKVKLYEEALLKDYRDALTMKKLYKVFVSIAPGNAGGITTFDGKTIDYKWIENLGIPAIDSKIFFFQTPQIFDGVKEFFNRKQAKALIGCYKRDVELDKALCYVSDFWHSFFMDLNGKDVHKAFETLKKAMDKEGLKDAYAIVPERKHG